MGFPIFCRDRRVKSDGGVDMTKSADDIGPYIFFVRDDQSGLIEPDVVSRSIAYDVVCKFDNLQFYDFFCKFVELYIEEVTRTLRDCMLIASSLTTILKTKQGYGATILTAVSAKFDHLLDNPKPEHTSDDLNAVLGATRLAIELNCAIDSKSAALARILEEIVDRDDTQEARDAILILHNNRDVIEQLYDGRLEPSSEDRLDCSIQTLERGE
jgi:hypothetical protein